MEERRDSKPTIIINTQNNEILLQYSSKGGSLTGYKHVMGWAISVHSDIGNTVCWFVYLLEDETRRRRKVSQNPYIIPIFQPLSDDLGGLGGEESRSQTR